MEIPKEIKEILSNIEKNGFSAHLVGGCVRDFLMQKEPKDWDIATNALPEDVLKIFKNSFSNNKFGTVAVLTSSKKENLKEVEITPYRIDEKYSDKRHPDSVKWVKNIEEDLKRRDFTINAMALKVESEKEKDKELNFKIIDLFNGKEDIKNKTIRTAGDPNERFNEDALRMARAVRFFSTLGFKIEENTRQAIIKNAKLLERISKERIRDEFIKIIMSDRAKEGIEELKNLGILYIFIPELEEALGVGQNKHHIYDCYKHAVLSLDYAVKKNFNMHVRIAALLHDIGKPKTKRGEGENSTFYNHEIVGAKMTRNILFRLKFPKKDIEKITKLVRYHLFYYNVGEVGEASVRRLVRNVGIENMEDLLSLRMADRIGSGVPKAEPYKLRHLKYLIDKVSEDPISVSMLKIGGKEVMEVFNISPGPKIGMALDILLSFVLNNPEENKRETLLKELEKIKELSEEELRKKAREAKKEREKVEIKKDEMVKEKYWVS